MSNNKPSEPPREGIPAGSAERSAKAHRPALVAIVVTLALMVGIVLKMTTRHHRIATNPPAQTTEQDPEPRAAE
jgi:hypothetical protein